MVPSLPFSSTVPTRRLRRTWLASSTSLPERMIEHGGGHGAATMVIFNLKNMAPDDYADKRQHEMSGGPVQIVISPDDARL